MIFELKNSSYTDLPTNFSQGVGWECFKVSDESEVQTSMIKKQKKNACFGDNI